MSKSKHEDNAKELKEGGQQPREDNHTNESYEDMTNVDETYHNLDYINNSRLEEAKGEGTSKPQEDKFDSAEHDMIGQKAFEVFKELLESEGLLDKFYEFKCIDDDFDEWKISENVSLTTGKVIALAGDYFGVAEWPICEGEADGSAERRFLAAYKTMKDAHHSKIDRLKIVVDKEIKEYHEKISHGLKPAVSYGAYVKMATFGGLPLTTLNSLYLASHNFDHFGSDAKIAYTTGHKVALKTAKDAANIEEGAEKYQTLALAFTQELFACHFLTDLFASGHVRTPRRELYNYVNEKIKTQLEQSLIGRKLGDRTITRIRDSLPGISLVAGFLAKAMHDEDNSLGLMVESPSSDEPWKTFGDACYVNISDANRDTIAGAVVKGLEDVLKFYKNPALEITDENMESLDVIPITPPREGINPGSNPLFRVVNRGTPDVTVELRGDFDDTSSTEYQQNWNITRTCASLLVHGFFKHHDGELTEAQKAEKLENEKSLQEEIERLYIDHEGRSEIEINKEKRGCSIL